MKPANGTTIQCLMDDHSLAESIIETAPAIILVLDTQGDVIRFNPFMEHLCGYTSEEAKGKNWIKHFIPKREQVRIASLFENCVSGQRVKGNVNTIVTRSGEERIIEWYDDHIHTEDNTAIGLVAIGLDITERKKMEGMLLHAQKMESIGQLSAGVAHEINTPIQFMNDNLQYIRDEVTTLLSIATHTHQVAFADQPAQSLEKMTTLQKQLQELDIEFLAEELPVAIDQCLDGAQRIATIVAGLKEFSHPGTTDKVLADINHCIENTVTISRNEWKSAATIDLQLDSQIPPIRCFPSELSQALLNIIVNATHAIQEQQNRNRNRNLGVITITSVLQENGVQISISDSGVGIPKELQSKVFDPFFTTKEVGSGTGQGASISRKIIVEKHKGELDFVSEVGKGTTFRIFIPNDMQH